MQSAGAVFHVTRFALACAVLAWAGTATAQTVLFVDGEATGANDGSSWENAFTDLQDALTLARGQGSSVTEIRVADGVYTPAPPSGEQAISFDLVDAVVLKGGYAGVSETDSNWRNPFLYKTELSGDLNGDDDLVPCTEDAPDCSAFGGRCIGGFCLLKQNTGENSHHVVSSGQNITAETVLDGFTITAGNAAITPTAPYGGGIYNVGGAPTIIGCTVVGNSAQTGAGMYNGAGMPTLFSCLFYDNSATFGAGGMYTGEATATVTNCTFVDNYGGFANEGGITTTGSGADTVVTNSILWGNFNYTGTSLVTQVSIQGSGSPSFDYSCVQGWGPVLPGVGSFGDDPEFLDSGSGNYRLDPDISPCMDTGDNAPPGGLPVLDLDASARVGNGIVDRGAYELADDCHGRNHPPDNEKLTSGASKDCDGNGLPDECDIDMDTPGGEFYCETDCDPDCNNNGIPDACEPDCNGNEIPDDCDVAADPSLDVCGEDPGNGIPDECEPDCNANGKPDSCDILSGSSDDCNDNGIPDRCEIHEDTLGGTFYCTVDCDPDCNANGEPDDCEVDRECNDNGVPDECDLLSGTSEDCDGNSIPDECEIWEGTPGGTYYCNINCDPDCNSNGVLDKCEPDCQPNNVPDECDFAQCGSEDCDQNGQPDECQPDSDGDGVIDRCEGVGCENTPPDVSVGPDGCPYQEGLCCILIQSTFVCVDNLTSDECSETGGLQRFISGLSGCQDDPDGDGRTGCDDYCPHDGSKWDDPGNSVFRCGCRVSDDPPPGDPVVDCNGNGIDDVCDINAATSPLCLGDEFGEADPYCEYSQDCNGNSIPDECEIPPGSEVPCGPFFCTSRCAGCPEVCDQLGAPCVIRQDCAAQGGNCTIVCDADCNNNGVPDYCDLDVCDEDPTCQDCNSNDKLDACDIADGTSDNCDQNDGNLVPDECQLDSDGDGIIDPCDPCTYGDDTLIGMPCDSPNDPDPCRSGVYDCPLDTLVCVGDDDAVDDQDGDGVFDCYDRCPDTTPETVVDPLGCPLEGACCDAGFCVPHRPPDCSNWPGFVYQGNGSNCEQGCRSPGSGDCDEDGDVDSFDWLVAYACLAESAGGPVTPGCACTDLNGDGYLNSLDFAGFQAELKECVYECPMCPPEAAGDCCDPDGLGTPGCGDSECCEAVCAANRVCCGFAGGVWAPFCAELAAEMDVCQCPVACCLFVGGCDERSASACVGAGIPQEPGSTCEDLNDIPGADACEVECPDGASGDCCDPAGLRDMQGCGNPDCCAAVCLFMPSCCEVEWTADCAYAGSGLPECDCPNVGCCVANICHDWMPVAQCVHFSVGGTVMGPDCLGDSDGDGWDDLCETCPPNSGSCCDPENQTRGCETESCCEAICASHPECCEVLWSPTCVGYAESQCNLCQ